MDGTVQIFVGINLRIIITQSRLYEMCRMDLQVLLWQYEYLTTELHFFKLGSIYTKINLTTDPSEMCMSPAINNVNVNSCAL